MCTAWLTASPRTPSCKLVVMTTWIRSAFCPPPPTAGRQKRWEELKRVPKAWPFCDGPQGLLHGWHVGPGPGFGGEIDASNRLWESRAGCRAQGRAALDMVLLAGARLSKGTEGPELWVEGGGGGGGGWRRVEGGAPGRGWTLGGGGAWQAVGRGSSETLCGAGEGGRKVDRSLDPRR